ncbi:MAG: hypothetical protein IK041_01295 [Bacteroidales bacterium]|nr:hypothetical protein [Bacteroidales bacterium]
MKLKVIKRFKDKNNLSIIYEVGQTVSFNDEARCSDVIARGLCEPVAEPKAEKASPALQKSINKPAKNSK